MTTATLSINGFIKACLAFSPEIVVCVRGRHAIGKSEVVRQVAAELGLPVIERRLSQMTEGDLIGLPVLSADAATTKFKPCDWLWEACQKPCVLFLDERNRALPAVKQAVFQLCDSRELYGNKLHPDTRVFIAENTGASYQVETNDPAEVSRAATCQLEPTVEEWLNYARKQELPGNVIGFIQANPECLEHSGMFEPNVKYPDRRTWDKLARELKRLKFLEDIESNAATFLGMSQMMLGLEVSNRFHSWVLENDKRISMDDILKSWTKVERRLKGSEGIIPKEYMAECARKIAEWIGTVQGEVTDHQAQQLILFSQVCPPELAQECAMRGSIRVATARHERNTTESAALCKVIAAFNNRLVHSFQTKEWTGTNPDSKEDSEK